MKVKYNKILKTLEIEEAEDGFSIRVGSIIEDTTNVISFNVPVDMDPLFFEEHLEAGESLDGE